MKLRKSALKLQSYQGLNIQSTVYVERNHTTFRALYVERNHTTCLLCLEASLT
jgi:hypothetical protein